MQIIRQHSKFHLPPFNPHLPLYLRLMCVALLGSMIVISNAVPIIFFMRSPSNPFAPYASGIAGASSEAEFWSSYETLSRAAFDLACTTSLTERHCRYLPLVGPFDEIRFMDLDDEGDKGVYFDVRPNALTVGDLGLLWGRPTIARHNNSLVLRWPEQHVSTVVRSDNRRFTYLLPVPYLLVAGEGA